LPELGGWPLTSPDPTEITISGHSNVTAQKPSCQKSWCWVLVKESQ